MALAQTANAQTSVPWKYYSIGETQIHVNLPGSLKQGASIDAPLGKATVFEGAFPDPVFSYSIAFYDRKLASPFNYDAWGQAVLDGVKKQSGFLGGNIIPVPTPGLDSKVVCWDVKTREGYNFTSILMMVGTKSDAVMLSVTYDTRREEGMKIAMKMMDSFRHVPKS